ncbi:MAG: response regulator transcription factor [Actinomycetota bacterium]
MNGSVRYVILFLALQGVKAKVKEAILVVDDEQNIVELVKLYLTNEGFTVSGATNGEEALKTFKSFQPSLIILDIMLPGMDGWEVCRRIRKESDVPIIMLTAKVSEVDKVVGLELGADDYLTKPFSPRELVARVKAVLRRVRGPAPKSPLRFGDLTIDIDKREVSLAEKKIDLTSTEFDVLRELASNPGIVYSRERLLQKVWGYDFFGGARTVDVHIRHLRQKLGDEGSRFIETIWGIGYRFKGK